MLLVLDRFIPFMFYRRPSGSLFSCLSNVLESNNRNINPKFGTSNYELVLKIDLCNFLGLAGHKLRNGGTQFFMCILCTLLFWLVAVGNHLLRTVMMYGNICLIELAKVNNRLTIRLNVLKFELV